MRLVGFIKESKKNSFAVPVYSGKEREFFFHILDDSYTITGFTVAQLNNTTFKKLYLSKKFDLGSKGALVFLGKEGYQKYDDAQTAIVEIINYIKDTSTFVAEETILEEALKIEKNVFSNINKIEERTVNSKSKKEQIILSFDFPSAIKESTIPENFMEQFPETNQESSNKILKLEQTEDPAFKSHIKHLNALEKDFELKLKMRAEERKSKLKSFNYQFHFGQKSLKGLNH